MVCCIGVLDLLLTFQDLIWMGIPVLIRFNFKMWIFKCNSSVLDLVPGANCFQLLDLSVLM